MPTSFWDHPVATIEKALHIRKQIEALKDSLNSILGGSSSASAPAPVKTGRRGRPPKNATAAAVVAEPAGGKVDGRKGKRSPAARARMAAAQKARWAARKAGKPAAVKVAKAAKAPKAPKATAAKPGRKKRTMSPEARERIAAAQRARWAKQKA